MRLILFDVDGTLIDSQAIIHETMRITFCRWGFAEPDPADTRSIIGLTLDTAIATMLERSVDDEILAMAADYKEIYLSLSAKPEMQSMAFAGICELVDRLASTADVRLGLVTGKSRRGVAKLVSTPEFNKRFSVARCADDCPSKPHPAMVLECCDELSIDPASTMVIGDTSFDMEMAKAAGATAVGVSWGYHSAERIHHAGATAIAQDASALDALIARWLSGASAARTSTQQTDDQSPFMPGFINRQLQYA